MILKLCNSISGIMQQHPGCRLNMLRFLKRNHHIVREADALGLRHGFELSEGGSGLPLNGDADREKMKLFKKQTGVSFPSLLRGELDPVWQLATTLVTSDVLNAEKGWDLVDSSSICPGDCDRLDFDLHVERSIALQYTNLIMGFGSEPTRDIPGLSFRKIRKVADKWWKDFKTFEVGPELIYQVRRIKSPRDGRELRARWLDKTENIFATVRARLLQFPEDRSAIQ